MKHKHYLLMLCLSLVLNGISQTITFNYTGSVQTYTVPAGVTSIQIEANGAQGGGTAGGNGGKSTGTFSVVPGTVYEIYVGGKPSAQLGAGGFNGGGAVLVLPCGGGDGWPGGGASDVRTSSSLANRIIVAGGGGGQGWSTGVGGLGGGTTGGDGAASWVTNTNGKGGTASAGGIGGLYSGNGGSGSPGTFGNGGNASPLDTYCAGGAGGGGWYGGGGGYVSAGGGGSSYIAYPGTQNASTVAGVQTGHGTVIITVLCSALIPTISATSVCEGNSVTMSASSTNGGTITWDNGIINGNSFVPPSGLNTYTASSSNPSDCGYTATITVNSLPTVNAGNDDAICEGTGITLSGTGNADDYIWNNGVTDGNEFFPNSGIITYTVTGTITTTGCQNTDVVELTVNALPAAPIATDQSFCGDAITDDLSASASGTIDWYDAAGNTLLNGSETLATGNYYALNTENGCLSDTTHIVVTVNPIPDSPIAQSQAFCGDAIVDDIIVSASGTIDWYTVSGNTVLNGTDVLVSGDYYALNTENGCISDSTFIAVTVHPMPAAPTAGTQNFCSSATVADLTAVGTGTLSWYDNASAGTPLVSTVPLTNGNYFVSATDNGCESPLTTVAVTIASVNAGVTNTDPVLTANQSNAIYQWGICEGTGGFNPISGATGQSFTATSNANYAVVVTFNGCTDMSSCEVIAHVGLEDNFWSTLEVYPNPTNGIVKIDLTSETVSDLKVRDAQGRVVLHTQLNNSLNEVSLADYPAGVYFFHINMDGKEKIVKVIRN